MTAKDFDVSGYETLPEHKGIFFTATDAGAGKTVVSGATGHYLASKGLNVDPFLPIALGCRRRRGDLVSDQAAFLGACVDSDLTIDQIAPMRFTTQANPRIAAENEGVKIDLEEIFEGYRFLCRRAQEGDPTSDTVIIVKGAGGLMCPITDDFWMIHLAALMALPVVVVVRPIPGAVNHTLLTLHAARRAGLKIAGVVINRYDPETEDIAVQTAAGGIAELGGVDILTVIPQDDETSVCQARLGADTQFAVSQAPWEKIIS